MDCIAALGSSPKWNLRLFVVSSSAIETVKFVATVCNWLVPRDILNVVPGAMLSSAIHRFHDQVWQLLGHNNITA